MAEGSLSSVLESRNHNRDVPVNKLAYKAFMMVSLEGFYPWLDESHPADSRQVQTCLDEIGTLADELSKERHAMGFSRAEFFSVSLTFLLNTLFVSEIPMAPLQYSGCCI